MTPAAMIMLMFAMWFMPIAKYQQLDDEGSFLSPILFVLLMCLLSSFLACSSMVFFSGLESWQHCLENLMTMLLYGIGGTVLGTLVLYPFWKSMGSTRSLLVSFKSVALSMALLPLFTILFFLFRSFGGESPFIYQTFWALFFLVWGGILMLLASRFTHHIQFPHMLASMPIFWILMGLLLITPRSQLATSPDVRVTNHIERAPAQDDPTATANTAVNPINKQQQNNVRKINGVDTKQATDIGELIIDNSFVPSSLSPRLTTSAYYSPYSEEGGRELVSVNGFRDADGNKVYRLQVDTRDIRYFWINAVVSPHEDVNAKSVATSSSAAADEATAKSNQVSAQPEMDHARAIVHDAVLMIADESGNEIIGGISFDEVEQLTFKNGYIYLIGNGKLFP